MNRLRLVFVALIVFLLATPAGSIGWPSPALAAPKPIPLPNIKGSSPDPDTLPGGSNPTDPGKRQRYDYENPAEALRTHENEPAPDDGAAQIAALSPEAEKAGTWEHCQKRWLEYQEKKAAERAAGKKTSPPLPWRTWLRRYIPNQGNDNQGKAFVLHVAQRLRLGANHGWRSEVHVPEVNRWYDLGNEELGLFYEIKSGRGVDDSELARDKKLIELERAKPNPRRLVYLFAEEPTKGAKAKLRDAGVSYFVVPALKNLITSGGDSGGGGAGTGGPKDGGPKDGGPTGAASDILRAPDQRGSQGAALDGFADSPDTPEEAAELARVDAQLAAESGHPELAQDLGGVDFSTLELRYVSDTYHNGSGVQYAFKADELPAADQQSFGGRHAAQLASDSFFVWLSLRPSSFTVNLNPDEPDRILDAQFGRTDAGRVLLEADLTMKKSVAKFIHPDTRGGQKYWDALRGETKCVSMRQWIVPDTATVRDNGNELYILSAPLQVKMESDVVKAQGVGGTAGCGQESQATIKHNESVYRTMILPQVQDAVNHAPEYADLRRVYASRVAAEWFRQRSATKHTAYSDLIDTGDISRWTSRESWSPREVFDRYVKSYKNGEFKVKRTTTRGNFIYTSTFVYGGVDFSRINRNPVSADAFAKEHPTLAGSVSDALYGPVGQGSEVWLGGLTTSKPLSEAFARPASATSNPLLYPLAALPLIAWLLTGGLLLRRRRAQVEPSRA
ncbi:hypothetical protein [Micromonospora rubida]|uniref:hypothetical protein n=1 Tax=Micromonospora rubida TaxID=2697657 RepID=UPI0013774A57|nr:hypothetical protein [Micromonospora rubida]NBE82579.1 hypothetical protein [Micromonospora rubida]